MKSKDKRWKLIIGIILLALSPMLLNLFMQEVVAKCVIGLAVIAAMVITAAKGLEINGLPDIFAVVLPIISPMLINFFSDIPFTEKAARVYTNIAQFFCSAIGKNIAVNISGEMSVTITFVLIFVLFESWNCQKDYTAMKILRGGKDEELKEKNFVEKSEMFCQTLRQWLEEINRETNWNEDQFTPLEAEVEMDYGGRRKNKYEDLIKCLKNNRRCGTVYLVLGSPGSGKSVSMRKLCLDLLKESKKTKKIPVYINLKEWNEEWSPEHMPEKKDLIVFIRKTFETKADFSTESFLNEYFQRMLEDGRWYFVFDSFDEMPCLMGKKNCQELIDGISALLYQFMTGPNQNGGVVASRLYKAPSSAVGASVTLKIQEFSDIKIKTMLKKYMVHHEEATKLLFGGREDMVSLCRNPFYLTLLINYFLDIGFVLPKNQMELFHNFVDGRLRKCHGKLEREGLSERDIYQASKELALFMQETEGCGLECPTRFLYRRGNEERWRKAFGLLKYAKICRLGGQDETISFVHRRFQEFFLVENIIDQKQVIEYENYRDILSDAGMRDALVLYCEIAEEEKAKEIANFCWKTIQTNIQFAHNIHNKESQELVCVMYFMKEAFRNRKDMLTDFIDDFYQLAEKIFDRRPVYKNNNAVKDNTYVDYVIQLALVNAMILFSKKQLEDLVLKVFQMNDRWLNDVIVQNCRILNTLGFHIENGFVSYFENMDIRSFLRRFSDMQFSLSISKKFKYVRKMHMMTMVMNITYVLIVISIAVFAVADMYEYFLYRGVSTINALQAIDNDESLPIILVSLVGIGLIGLLVRDSVGNQFRWQNIIIFSFYLEIGLSLFFLYNKRLLIIGMAETAISIVVIIIILILLSNHALKFYIHDIKSLKEILLDFAKVIGIAALATVTVGCGMFILISHEKIFFIMAAIFVTVFFIGLLALLIKGVLGVLNYLKDCMWFRKHFSESGHVWRAQLEDNLKIVHFNRIKYKYLERLLLQNVELKGTWSDDIRPQYEDDRVNHALAKLDCMKLDSCDYLF